MVECLDSSVAAIPFSFSSSFDSLLSSRELEVYRLYFPTFIVAFPSASYRFRSLSFIPIIKFICSSSSLERHAKFALDRLFSSLAIPLSSLLSLLTTLRNEDVQRSTVTFTAESRGIGTSDRLVRSREFICKFPPLHTLTLIPPNTFGYAHRVLN